MMLQNFVHNVKNTKWTFILSWRGPFTPKIFYIGWTSDRMGSYAILYSIYTHQMQKGWRLDLDRIGSAMSTKKNRSVPVGPGLSQLVERLAHRYSESTSLNPGNFTSTTVCGDRTDCGPAAKRSTCVAPEVDLRECKKEKYITQHNKKKIKFAWKDSNPMSIYGIFKK